MIYGYEPVGKVVGRMLARKFIRWIAVDIDNKTVIKSKNSILPVVYGDIVRPLELVETNGWSVPQAFVVTLADDEVVKDTLAAIQAGFPGSPVYVRAKNLKQQRQFLKQGARALYPESFETSLQLGQSMLKGFETSKVDISAIKAEVRGDCGLNEVFKEYDEWFKSGKMAPSNPPADDKGVDADVKNHADNGTIKANDPGTMAGSGRTGDNHIDSNNTK